MRATRRRIARRCGCDEERPSPSSAGVRRRPAPGGSAASLERARRLGHRPAFGAGPSPTTGRDGPVQRMVDLTRAPATANGRYFVHPADSGVLVSAPEAEPPAPRPLYGRKADVSQLDAPVFLWRPNVRLISGQERQRDPDPGALARHTEMLYSDVPLRQQPSLGVLGKNDCDFFAGTLQYLIAANRRRFAKKKRGDTTLDLEEDEAPELGVGDRMRHKFQGQQQCGHHAATVVAKDGASLVTLEAHVSQELQHPEFHIRNGATGFVHDNDTAPNQQSRGLGSEVEFRFLDHLTQEETEQELGASRRRYGRITGRETVPKTPPFAFLGTGLGITAEPGRERGRRMRRLQGLAVEAIQALLGDGRWPSQGVGVFGSSTTPSGVSSLQKLMGSKSSAGAKLREMLSIVAKRSTKGGEKRSEATQALYDALARVDPYVPDLDALDDDLEEVVRKL